MALKDAKVLFQAVVDLEQKYKAAVNVSLQTLMVAYQNAPTKSLRLKYWVFMLIDSHLTSLNAYISHLKTSPIDKKARAQAMSEMPVEKIPRHRTQQRQLDHFLELTMRPYYYQDVAYGTRTIKLESVEEFVRPNMVRTVVKCTIIKQYMDHCKENGFEPISKSTMWWVLEVQEATQRKSLRGLDNASAEGADGFKNFSKL